jgi:hypothetical protein
MSEGIKQSCSRLVEDWYFPLVMDREEEVAISAARRSLAKAILEICIPPNPGASLLARIKALEAALKAIQEGLASIVEDEDLDDGKLREHSESTLPNLCDIATKALSPYRATPPEGTPE